MSSFSSFRDPGGCCFEYDGRILRAVSPEALEEIEPFLNSITIRALQASRLLVPFQKLCAIERDALAVSQEFQRLTGGRSVAAVFEHKKVEFVSYPHEWAPEMLSAAGMLTLDLAQSSLEEGYGLKDATPYNVLFEGSAPVFVDLLSFERRNPCDPVWKPDAQFCRTFLLPLLAYKFWGIRPADVFVNRRDGLEPAEVYRFCGPFRRLLPPMLTQVSLPTWLVRRTNTKSLYRDHLLSSPERARFILDSLFRRLRRALKSAHSAGVGKTGWSGYMRSHGYPEAAFKDKEDFISRFLLQHRPKRVLDVGSNVGHFSVLASKSGAGVVAIDSDSACIGTLWRQARLENLNILPLVIDLSRPSSANGWRNRESSGFLERAAHAFDAVLMLAVVHHLIITERVPLEEVLDLAAELTARWLIIEYVSPEDEMFRRLTRGRDCLYAGITKAVFEAVCLRRFRLVQCQDLSDTHRSLYLLEKAS